MSTKIVLHHYTKHLKVRLSEEEYKKLEFLAEINDVSKAEICRCIVDIACDGKPNGVARAAERITNPAHQKLWEKLEDARRELARQGGLLKKLYKDNPTDTQAIKEAWRNYTESLKATNEAMEEFTKVYDL